jgi:hypothetical protein
MTGTSENDAEAGGTDPRGMTMPNPSLMTLCLAALVVLGCCAFLISFAIRQPWPPPDYGHGSLILATEPDAYGTSVKLRVSVSPRAQTTPTWRDLCRQYGVSQAICQNTIDRYNLQRDPSVPLQDRDSPIPSGKDILIELGHEGP